MSSLEADPAPPLPHRPGWPLARVVALVLACSFLGGALGYAVATIEANGSSSKVDVGFLQDMLTHHQQAVEMALIAGDKAQDPLVRDFAQEILVFQQREVGLMEAYLAEMGQEPGERDPTAMAWMDMPVPVESMPGLATEAEFDELFELEGAAFDVRFLELMKQHHVGGLHMAEVAASRADARKVRELADFIARNQPIEVNEYEIIIERIQGSDS